MISIASVSTQSPRYSYSRAEILDAARGWLENRQTAGALMEKFLTTCQINSRSFVVPIDEILKIGGPAARAKIFAEEGQILAESVLNEALTKAGLSAKEIKALVFSSCTAPLIPSIDATLVTNSGMDQSTVRVPMYQHGCAGGAVGIALGAELCRTMGPVAVVAVEACSLGFQPEDLTTGNLVGTALFADGAACAILRPQETGWTVAGTRSFLIPNTEWLMGYDIHDNGTHLRLDKELPNVLSQNVGEFISMFLRSHQLEARAIDHWLVHPGGVKILSMIESEFCGPGRSLDYSWSVLSKWGNLSSASVLYVLNEMLCSGEAELGDTALMIGIGPGLTVQLNLFVYK